MIVKCGACDTKITLKRKAGYFRHCGILQEITPTNTLFIGASRSKQKPPMAKEDQPSEIVIEP
jgi:hypothetical protein